MQITALIVQETSANVFTEIFPGASILYDEALHPWQVTELWSDAELAEINTYRVAPVPPPAGQQVTGYTFARDANGVVQQVLTLVTPAVTPANVLAERDRRLALGFSYDFGDARGVHRIGTTPADMIGWDEVTKYANALAATGAAATTIAIVTDTGPTQVTPQDWMKVLVAAGEFREPIWHASFVLEAQNPIPADYTADAHWPA